MHATRSSESTPVWTILKKPSSQLENRGAMPFCIVCPLDRQVWIY
jgi:hypothetical protein